MQQEGQQNHQSDMLPKSPTDLLALFLEGPTPEVEYRITNFSIEIYFMILSDRDQAKEIRLACATALKEALNKIEVYRNSADQILTQLEALYLTCQSQISGALELVLEKMFELYFHDQKKLAIFQKVIDKLTACTDIKASYINQRVVKITILLVRVMDTTTLNNQICIGSLFCYLKHLYYNQNKTADLANPSGRGLQLLIEAMNNDSIPQLQSFIGLQAEIVKMMREIVDRVQEDESEEPEVIPTSYIRNSSEIERLMSGIICVSPNGKIHCKNEVVNELKGNLLQLYADIYMYHLEKPFLLAALGTITSTSAAQLKDYSMQIISTLLLLVERSTSFSEFAETFFNVTQVLVIKLFELISAKQAEREAITDDPQYFAEIADDFCKTQESDTIKARAGSLLYNLCLCIDGNLTFITNFALISLLDFQRKAVLTLMPGVQPDPSTLQSENAMKTLLDLWPCGAEQFTQTSILVLSSISDLLLKRPEFNTSIRRHLNNMAVLFSLRDQTLKFFPVIIICRYVQLFSFFSSPNCLDPFLPFYSLNQSIAQCILKALQTIIQFHDKKDDNMRTYVSMISTRVLLLSDKLTPLLQSTIISRPQLLLCVKERLIEKLVVWLLQFLTKGNVFSCNKIANLLCKVLEKYPDYLVHTDEQLYRMQLETLTQYISPLYRHLVTSEYQDAEECVVDIAVAHCEVLKNSIDLRTAQQFLHMGTLVVKRNNGVLNKCLELFSRLLSQPHAKVMMQKADFMVMQKIRLMVATQLLKHSRVWLQTVENRTQNIWQIVYLIELSLATYEISQQKPTEQLFDFLGTLFHLTETINSPILTLKTILIAFLTMKLAPNIVTQNWLLRVALPEVLPPWQKDHLCIYILRAIKHFKVIQVRARFINYILLLILPNDKLKKYMESYEDRIHCLGADQAEVFAFQTAKDVVHPFSCAPIDTFDQFKKMFSQETQWQEIRRLLGPIGDTRIREALSIKKVGPRLRHIVKVKGLNLRS